MQQNATTDHAGNLLMLVVNDMNRLFFCKEKKMFSISFPLHTECYPTIHFDLDKIEIVTNSMDKIKKYLDAMAV